MTELGESVRASGHTLNESIAEHSYVFLQWKGTNACFDFYCECGEHCHIDADFAYFIHCDECGRTYRMPSYLYPQEVDPAKDDQYAQSLCIDSRRFA